MLIAIEGIDGSGKGTQTSLLNEELKKRSYSVKTFQFPRYEETFFGNEIGLYLNGHFGDLMSVHPKLGALLYAGDRFESKTLVKQSCNEFDFVLCDRYTPSNQAHHAAKLPKKDWKSFFSWSETLEYEIFGIPKPDLILFLDLESSKASSLIQKKPERSYTEKKADIHEIDTDYQSNVHSAYLELAVKSPWVKIQCIENNQLKTAEEIHNRVMEAVLKREH